MRVMNQGSEYEEDATTTDAIEEGDEETSAGIGKIAGIPVKFIVIGVAVVVLMALFVIVFGSKKDDNPMSDAVIPANDPEFSTGSNTTPQTYTWYSSTGTYLGISLDNSEGTSVYDGSTLTATITASGADVITDTRGASVHATLVAQTPVDPNAGQTTTPPTGDTGNIPATGTGSFTAEQIETLRKLGYTGDEISVAARDYLSYDALVEAAQTLRDQEAMDAVVRMSDQASDEFKSLLYWGIFGLGSREFTPRNNEQIAYNQPGSYLVNADYEKVPTYGLQLWLRVKIANNTFVYMPMEPQRWETLPDSGNIVVRVNYVRYGTNDVNDVYITSVVEQDITAITVNPEDSTQDFGDLVALPQ